MCILNNTKIRTVAEPNSLVYLNPEREICLYDETTLFSSNITNNDAQIENVLNYYPEIRSKLIENNVKVSIIIPVYNVENELKQCLDSVCNQTLKDIEIICINDGSTDRSPEILNEYAQRDSRIKVINNSNSGAAVSRNIGLSIAKGEYIGFVDGDDWVDENYYSSLYYTAFYSGADVARCTYKYCYPDCVYNSELNHIIEKRSELGENLHVNEHSVVIWNAIYRLDFLKENGICYFNQDLKMCHDIPFTTRVDFLSGKTVPAVGTNYYYRKGRIGQLVTPSIERLKYSVKANMYVIEFLNSFANIEKNDYIVAYKRVLNRFKGFYNDYKSHEDFSSDVEKEFMKKYQEVCDKCKYPQELQIPVLLQEICA
ncbi:glycosyltransferase [bacterium]|nr:glycosyltransferase [bacterium]